MYFWLGREEECKEKVAAITQQFENYKEGALLLEQVFFYLFFIYF